MTIHREVKSDVGAAPLEIAIAREPREVEAAQRLRFRVFGEELGAVLPSAASGLDRDAFDPFCDHLLVREATSGDVVGTYRILPAGVRRAREGSYTATEFDLGRLVGAARIGRGRPGVHRPALSNGSVLALLWAGLAAHLRTSGCEHVMGCASLPANDTGYAADACARLLRDHGAPREWQVTPSPAAAARRRESR